MEKFYSKVDPTKLLHIVVKLEDLQFCNGRIDLILPENFIQCSMLHLSKDDTFKPHKHISKQRTRDVIAQESWHVVQGRVECIFYDIDDTILAKPILERGDTSFTLVGGHNYRCLSFDTLVLEYKTGPYEGQALDKVFI